MIPPCSQRERAAVEALASGLQEQGYAVEVEDFAARPSNEPWLAAYAGLVVVAALIVYAAPLSAAILGAIGVVLHARESDGRPLFQRYSCVAANVVARSPATPRPALVVVAPLSAAPRRFPEATQRALVVALQVAMASVAGGGAVAWVVEAERELPVAVAAAGAAAAGIVAVLAIVLYGSRALRGDRSETAPLLPDLAPLLRDHPAWLVGTGGRRGGSAGIQALVADHPEAGGAAWLNLEPGSDGAVFAASEEGTWRERRADRYLLGAAEEAGAAVRPYRAGPTDATVLLARRRRALTLMVGVPAEGLRIAAAVASAVLAKVRR